jgi:uncharacterized membrane protein YfcA
MSACAWFAAAWFVGGFVNGITGFGAAMAAMPFALLGMDVKQAVPACSLMVLVVSLEQGLRYGGFADWPRVLPLILGAVPGAFAGALALRFLPPQHLQSALGCFLVCFAFWGLFLEGTRPVRIARAWGCVAGFLSAAFGTAFSFNGPPLAVYTALSGWNKETGKAGLALFFIITCVLMIISQSIAGMHGKATVLPVLGAAPGALAGAALGFRVARGMSEAAYRKLLFLFLGLAGVTFLRG